MDKHEIGELIQKMQPKIIKSLSNTAYQEREDLKQDLHLKIIQTITQKKINHVYGFWDLKEKIKNSTD